MPQGVEGVNVFLCNLKALKVSKVDANILPLEKNVLKKKSYSEVFLHSAVCNYS